MSIDTIIYKFKKEVGLIKPRKRRVTKQTKIKRLRTQASKVGMKVVSKSYGRKPKRKVYKKSSRKRNYRR